MANIIQWNTNGFFRRLPEIQQLIKTIEPSTICLQETNLLPKQNANLNNFTIYRKDYEGGLRGSRGILTAVRNNYHSEPINIQTQLETIIVKVHLQANILIHICNIYLPHDHFNATDHEALLEQLPKPYLILGDFNAHHQMWGSLRNNTRGNANEKIYLKATDMCLLNEEQPTHLSLINGEFTSIDLSFSSNEIAPKLTWNAHQDLCGSDHFPIIIKFQTSKTASTHYPIRWKTGKANWEEYRELTKIENSKLEGDIDDIISHFNTTVLNAAEITIPKTSGKCKNTPVP